MRNKLVRQQVSELENSQNHSRIIMMLTTREYPANRATPPSRHKRIGRVPSPPTHASRRARLLVLMIAAWVAVGAAPMRRFL